MGAEKRGRSEGNGRPRGVRARTEALVPRRPHSWRVCWLFYSSLLLLVFFLATLPAPQGLLGPEREAKN